VRVCCLKHTYVNLFLGAGSAGRKRIHALRGRSTQCNTGEVIGFGKLFPDLWPKIEISIEKLAKMATSSSVLCGKLSAESPSGAGISRCLLSSLERRENSSVRPW
jgi:hypothetical protein